MLEEREGEMPINSFFMVPKGKFIVPSVDGKVKEEMEGEQ